MLSKGSKLNIPSVQLHWGWYKVTLRIVHVDNLQNFHTNIHIQTSTLQEYYFAENVQIFISKYHFSVI